MSICTPELLSLPAELKDQIYRHATSDVPSGKIIFYDLRPYDDVDPTKPWDLFHALTLKFPPAITAPRRLPLAEICRTVNGEMGSAIQDLKFTFRIDENRQACWGAGTTSPDLPSFPRDRKLILLTFEGLDTVKDRAFVINALHQYVHMQWLVKIQTVTDRHDSMTLRVTRIGSKVMRSSAIKDAVKHAKSVAQPCTHRQANSGEHTSAEHVAKPRRSGRRITPSRRLIESQSCSKGLRKHLKMLYD